MSEQFPTAPQQRRTHQAVDLCLQVGEILMSNGAGAADVSSSMQLLAGNLGLVGIEVDVTFTSLSMSCQDPSGIRPVVLLRQVKQRDIDYEDLTRVDHLIRQVINGDLDLVGARAEAARIAETGHTHPRWVVTIAWGMMCVGIAIMLGGGPAVIALAGLAGGTIDLLQQRLARRRLPAFYLQVVGGLTASVIALTAVAVGLDVDPSLAVTANIIMLLSGIGFMAALHDALTGFYVTASARLLEALLATAGLIAGVSGGLTIASVAGVEIDRLVPGRIIELDAVGLIAAGAGLAAAAFAVASYSPKRVVAPIFLVASLGIAISQIMGYFGFDRPWSVGVAALILGMLSHPIARWARTPLLVIVVSAVVPMLPGVAIYRGLALLSNADDAAPAQGILSIMEAASIALAIAAGVILAEYLMQPIDRKVRKIAARRPNAGYHPSTSSQPVVASTVYAADPAQPIELNTMELGIDDLAEIDERLRGPRLVGPRGDEGSTD